MRGLMIGLAALLLSGCGGSSEVYPIPAGDAFRTLSSIGRPSGMNPLPGGLTPVSVRFEALPGDNLVQWLFTHDGDDIGRIVAKVEPKDDTSSNVTVNYVQGAAPDEHWRNGQARRLIQQEIHRLAVEAVDSKLENRPFDQNLRMDVIKSVTMNSIGSVMNDVSSSMDKMIKERKEREAASENAGSSNPYTATKPSMDLSKFNSN
jgi:hypothetical protein